MRRNGRSDLGVTPSTLDALTQPATPPPTACVTKCACRYGVFAWLYQAVPDVSVRLLLKGIWNARPRRLLRVRRSGYRHRIRLRNEQNGLPPMERSEGTCAFAKRCSMTSWRPGRKHNSLSKRQRPISRSVRRDQRRLAAIAWRRSTVTKRPPPPRAMGTAAGVAATVRRAVWCGQSAVWRIASR